MDDTASPKCPKCRKRLRRLGGKLIPGCSPDRDIDCYVYIAYMCDKCDKAYYDVFDGGPLRKRVDVI